MKRRTAISAGILLLVCGAALASAQDINKKAIPRGAKVYVAAMPDGFDDHLKAAIQKKGVPVEVVADREQAQFEITGVSETQKAGKAKKILMLDWRSTESASITVASLETSEVVFAYSVHLQSSQRGKRSSAESCAKHLKKAIAK